MTIEQKQAVEKLRQAFLTGNITRDLVSSVDEVLDNAISERMPLNMFPATPSILHDDVIRAVITTFNPDQVTVENTQLLTYLTSMTTMLKNLEEVYIAHKVARSQIEGLSEYLEKLPTTDGKPYSSKTLSHLPEIKPFLLDITDTPEGVEYLERALRAFGEVEPLLQGLFGDISIGFFLCETLPTGVLNILEYISKSLAFHLYDTAVNKETTIPSGMYTKYRVGESLKFEIFISSTYRWLTTIKLP